MPRRISRKLLVTRRLAFQCVCVLLLTVIQTGRLTMQASAFSGVRVSNRSPWMSICRDVKICLGNSSKSQNQRIGFNPIVRLSTTTRRPYHATQALRHFHKSSTLFMAASTDEGEKFPQEKKGGIGGKKKIKLRDEKDFDLDALAAAFDDMARKEGFDDSKAFYAGDETFDAEFDEVDYENTDFAIDREGGGFDEKQFSTNLHSSRD